ncbi:MAG TPA: GNAT family N-acetyltransferase [Candidatus Limnocylindrales bacterium]|nr:GNAT family N-acetyltransferase [Candidatus Limnocylindrales bacterium]
MDFRPILLGDVATCAEIFWAADDDLMLRAGLPPNPRNEARLFSLFEHIVANDPERGWLAENDGQPTGFAMSVQRGDLTFLAMLFVMPKAQARGLGRELLERSMAESSRRAVSIFSVQPISGALYAQYGMVPLVPMYTMTGRPRVELPALADSLTVGPVEAAAVDPIDLEVTGFTRQVDHAAWQAWGRVRFGLFEGGELAGYGYAQQAGRIGPVMVRRPELVLPFVGQLMKEIEPVEDWMLNVPGPAAEPFESLLKAGMRFDGPPIIYCATDGRTDHSRYMPATFALP